MSAFDADRQRAVLDGAMRLFEQYDLKDITLDRLTKVTGIPAFDILREYHSSDNILKAVLERELELMAAAAQAPELRMPGETLGDELHVLAGVILDQYRKRSKFLAKILNESMQNPDVGALFYRTFIVQGRLLFTEFLSVRKERNELRDDVDVEAAAAMFLAALTGTFIMHEVFGGRKVEPLDDERVLSQMCNTFLRGVMRK
ncbi:MAG TPA: TetR/AcrR family transcriptional regulator C-terminal domain-containing protein [Bryobacteraceae bacterium]|nr:TetR/AcrR family transcriptional regulator C-terminal domain-containing protein [Bryobacteraceae bacterium]